MTRSSRTLIAVSFVFAVALRGVPAQGSTPIHQPLPALAEPADTTQSFLDLLEARSSIRFNIPNDLWDRGEGFDEDFDSGGYRGLDLGSALTAANIERLHDWGSHADAWSEGSYFRFAGALTVSDPSKLPSGSERKKPSFELYAPFEFKPERPSVLVMSLMPTMPVQGGAIAQGVKTTDYPGRGDNGLFTYDLFQLPANDRGQGPDPRGQTVVARSPDLDINIFAAYIVPAEHWNPAALVIQRAHHLVRAVEIKLEQRYPSLDFSQKPIPCVVAGGSFGGYCSLALVLDFPNRFHGALSDVTYLASLRRVVGVDDARQFAYRLTAFPPRGVGRFGAQRELQWAFGFDQLDESWLAASLVERFRSNQEIRRPVFLTLSDEDMVTTAAHEFLELLQPNPGRSGSVDLPATAQNFTPKIYWSVREKQAHNAGKGVTPPMPASATQGSPIEQVIVDALQSAQTAPTVTVPTRSEPNLPTGWVVDPFDPVLARPGDRGVPTHTVPPSDQGVLVRDSAFDANQVRVGMGLENTIVHNGFILVGSSDGFVSVLDWDTATSQCVVVSRSPELGYGISSMALNSGNDRLAVATYRGLHVLDYDPATGQLGIVHHTTDSTYASDWKYSAPRSLSYANVFGTEDLVYVTSRGGLFIRSGDLATERFHWPEPGIRQVTAIDLGANLHPSATGNRQLSISSAREHTFHVEVAQPDQVWLRCVTPPADIGGGAEEARVIPWPDQHTAPVLAVAADGQHSIQLFDATTLDHVASIADFTSLSEDFCNGTFKTSERQLPIRFDLLSENPYCVAALHDNMLYLLDGQGAVIGSKALVTLPGAIDPVSIACGDIMPDPGNEIVLGTRWGSVVVLRESDITASPSPDSRFFTTSVGPGQVLRTGSGGWALCKDPTLDRLHTVAGINYWTLEPNGVMSPGPLLDHVRFYVGTPAVPPILDMAYMGDDLALRSRNWSNPGAGAFSMDLNDFSVQADFTGDPKFKHLLSATTRTVRNPLEYFPIGRDQIWFNVASFVGIHNNFWIFTHGGDVREIAEGERVAMYWSGEEDPACSSFFQGSPNHVLRCDYELLTPPGEGESEFQATGVWGSSGSLQGTQLSDFNEFFTKPILGDPKPAALDFKDLRNDSRSGDDWQSLRLFRPQGELGPVLSAVTAVGGYVQVMNAAGDPDTIEYQAEDLGYGGLALAVGDLTGDGGEEIVYGVLYSDTDHNGLQAMSAKIGVVDKIGTQYQTTQVIDLGALGLDPLVMPGFGVAGIAIGDVLGGEAYDGNEVVVTTLNGELYLFKTDGGAPIVPVPVHASVHPGALGVANSIVIEDLDSSDVPPEIYVGSSQGFYRFNVVPN